MKGKVLVAMSGGVDSSVAAYLAKEAGWELIGVTMKLFDGEVESTCCSLEDTEDAADVARKLGIRHYVFNFKDRFRRDVIDRFVAAYEAGMTPNPCIDCNRYLKFDELFRRARELGCERVITGHYARIDEEKGKRVLKKALDPAKDQSYVLYSLADGMLPFVEFPLGTMKKDEVRALAEKLGFVNAKKHDSQDICFVPEGKYHEFIEEATGRKYPPGNFVDREGNVLGEHRGIIRYTIGQRRGLGLALPESLYVLGVDVEKNEVVLGREEELFSSALTARDLSLSPGFLENGPARVRARVRYRQPEKDATVERTGPDEVKVVFDEPLRAITPGQTVVFYDGDAVLGGGVITKNR
ncbi:MAG: tRNA 2-thiouridine(34) synthase MnmA [Clostridia bacterium]|nr:tRNA 2-thiouridine(34) synthase MnmA [Clostridia bacterium]